MEIIDLTKPLDENLSVYSNEAYSDPPLQIEPWCTIEEQGFKVSRISLGTQTGTHIDAPAHFIAGGATLEALSLQALMGSYLWFDLDRLTQIDLSELSSYYHGETILFLASSEPAGVELSPEVFEALLELPCLVWLVVNSVRVVGGDEYYFHRTLAEAGKYLIEEVEESMAARVKACGEMMALPLRLSGVTGSPCRVVVRQKEP